MTSPAAEKVYYRGGSEANRVDKEFTVAYQVGLNTAVPVHGLVLSYFLDRNTLLQFEAVSGRYTTDNWSWSNHETRREMSSYGIHLKRFPGNSFYYSVGLDWRDYNYTYTYTSSNPTYNVYSTFSGQSLNAFVGIGNQWQWGNFTMGCEWAGVNLPFALQRISNENLVSPTLYEYEREDLDRQQDQAIKYPQLRLVNFYIGASF